MALSGDGRTLYVADSNNDRVSVWGRSGSDWAHQSIVGSAGDGPDQFANPVGVELSGDGQTLYVADSNNNRVSVWARTGPDWTHQSNFGSAGDGPDQLSYPETLALSGDGRTLYVLDTENHQVSVWGLSCPP